MKLDELVAKFNGAKAKRDAIVTREQRAADFEKVRSEVMASFLLILEPQLRLLFTAMDGLELSSPSKWTRGSHSDMCYRLSVKCKDVLDSDVWVYMENNSLDIVAHGGQLDISCDVICRLHGDSWSFQKVDYGPYPARKNRPLKTSHSDISDLNNACLVMLDDLMKELRE